MTDLLPDERYATPTRVHVDGVPLAVIRHEGVTLGDLDDLFDADYAVINAAADAGRFDITGPPLAVYHGYVQETFDVEIGMPIGRAVDGAPMPVIGSELPDGTAVALTHVGSYTNLGASWGALVRGADATPTGCWAEVYVTEPGLVAVERLRTDLFLYVDD